MAHRRNVVSLSLFYRYYFGRCSSELAQLVPFPYFRGRSTRYTDRLHCFSITIPRCIRMFLSTVSFLDYLWCSDGDMVLMLYGVVVITTAQLHSLKFELRFCSGSNPIRSVSEIRDGEDL